MVQLNSIQTDTSQRKLFAREPSNCGRAYQLQISYFHVRCALTAYFNRGFSAFTIIAGQDFLFFQLHFQFPLRSRSLFGLNISCDAASY